MSERAAIVIPLPLSVVESNMWDVTSWPCFLGDVDWVRRSSHERYLFGIRQGRRLDETLVAVRWHARDHRVTWRELEGPQWRGELRLSSVNGRRTRVTLGVTVHPRGFVASLVEMLGGRERDLASDLRRLSERLGNIPQPRYAARLGVAERRIQPARSSGATSSGATSAWAAPAGATSAWAASSAVEEQEFEGVFEGVFEASVELSEAVA